MCELDLIFHMDKVLVIKHLFQSVTKKTLAGPLDPERAGDGRDGAGDQHVRDYAENRGAEQD